MSTQPPPLVDLRSARFRAEREADWQRLDALVTRAERRGLTRLSFEDARDLAGLYRTTINALSVARAISLDRALLTYLEALSARAYLVVYAPAPRLAGRVQRLLRVGIPNAVRRVLPALALAYAALILGGLVGYLLYFDDPTWYGTLMPAELVQGRDTTSTRAELLDVLQSGSDQALDDLAGFAGFLFSHNTRVAILTFALGILACWPSLFLVFAFGLSLGAFVGLHVERGLAYELFAWLSIHGVTELSAIAVAAAGGVHLGFALLFPGRATRADALRRNGRDAVKLAVLAAFMLCVAAVIEGFGRQLIQDPAARIVVGWGIGLLWIGWLYGAGRGQGG